MRTNRQIIQTAIATGIIYAVVMLVMQGDYSGDSIIRVFVQGVIFTLVFGLAIWLMNRFRKPKK